MKIEKRKINNSNVDVITADWGYIFLRIHDEFVMDSEIVLGFDYSTGIKREDKIEYYKEISKEEALQYGYENTF